MYAQNKAVTVIRIASGAQLQICNPIKKPEAAITAPKMNIPQPNEPITNLNLTISLATPQKRNPQRIKNAPKILFTNL